VPEAKLLPSEPTAERRAARVLEPIPGIDNRFAPGKLLKSSSLVGDRMSSILLSNSSMALLRLSTCPRKILRFEPLASFALPEKIEFLAVSISC